MKHYRWEDRLNGNEVPLREDAIVTHMQIYGTVLPVKHKMLSGYFRHAVRVIGHFATRPADLLVMDICSGDGWELLCPYLGKTIPEEPFPLDIASRPRTRFPQSLAAEWTIRVCG